ncbi:MAG: metallophosphoesterase [Acidobacteriaceae bacterium]|nr:metallophosphoesterase [Acidobacteriaceae bacterium]
MERFSFQEAAFSECRNHEFSVAVDLKSGARNYRLNPAMLLADPIEQRSLAERLKPRIAVEQFFAQTGRKFRKKNFVLRHERTVVRPYLKFGLQIAGLYRRGIKNALAPLIRHLRLEFPDLPAAFHGFQILHISDFHIDGCPGLLEALAPMLSELEPDVCVLTGDYRFEDEGPCEAVYPLMRSILSNISTKQGIFGILGNHDASEIAFSLEEMGVRMLVNEAAEIRKNHASVWFIGVDDPFDYQCADLDSALAPVGTNDFKILLAHTPELYEDASQRGIHLYLCGHTHAGQIRFPAIGSLRHNADCPKSYSYGHWIHKGMHGYTSAGVGCSSLPIRYNCPPEITLIELRSQIE